MTGFSAAKGWLSQKLQHRKPAKPHSPSLNYDMLQQAVQSEGTGSDCSELEALTSKNCPCRGVTMTTEHRSISVKCSVCCPSQKDATRFGKPPKLLAQV